MRILRYWSVTHADKLLRIYRKLEYVMLKLDPLFQRLGYRRIEKPMALVESAVKKTLFDCQMCGQCVLSSTGMACPMNCPKQLRNGPCGGVRSNGHCEVKPGMRCVWLEAIRGSEIMKQETSMGYRQLPLNHSIKGHSSWLQAVKTRAREKS